LEIIAPRQRFGRNLELRRMRFLLEGIAED
jgi:hypothetical protein